MTASHPSLPHGGPALLVVSAVGSRLKSRYPKAPVCLYVPVMDPHSPYLSPPGSRFARKVQNFAGTRKSARLAYLDEVRFTDRQIGRLLRALRRHPAFRKAVIAVTADHGEEFYEHGGISHGYTLFDELLRVPFIVSAETIPAGIETRETQGIDLAPPLLAACGVSAPPAFEGRDLSSSSFAGEDLLFEEEFSGVRLLSIKSGGLKLITGRGKQGQVTQLFDLDRDPRELRPLAREKDEHRLIERTRSMSRGRKATASRPEDAKRERRLRALGYLK